MEFTNNKHFIYLDLILIRQISFFFQNLFNPRKVIMSLRHKGLLGVKENDRRKNKIQEDR